MRFDFIRSMSEALTGINNFELATLDKRVHKDIVCDGILAANAAGLLDAYRAVSRM